MKIESLEVFSSESNYAIIKPPGRNYPGCVIQGDSLAALCRMAGNIARSVQAHRADDADFLNNVESLNNALINRILHYQRVLTDHGIEFPHVHPFSESDLVELLPDDDARE